MTVIFHLDGTITSYDGSGLSLKHICALQKAGIYNWREAKKALKDDKLKEIHGIGDLAISLIEQARPKGELNEIR